MFCFCHICENVSRAIKKIKSLKKDFFFFYKKLHNTQLLNWAALPQMVENAVSFVINLHTASAGNELDQINNAEQEQVFVCFVVWFDFILMWWLPRCKSGHGNIYHMPPNKVSESLMLPASPLASWTIRRLSATSRLKNSPIFQWNLWKQQCAFFLQQPSMIPFSSGGLLA